MNLSHLFPKLFITFLADRRAMDRIPHEISSHPELLEGVEGRWRLVPLTDPKSPEISHVEHDKIQAEVAGQFDATFTRILKGDTEAEPGGFRTVPRTIIVDVCQRRMTYPTV